MVIKMHLWLISIFKYTYVFVHFLLVALQPVYFTISAILSSIQGNFHGSVYYSPIPDRRTAIINTAQKLKAFRDTVKGMES